MGIEYVVANLALGVVGTVAAMVICKKTKPTICDTCKYLKRKGGGTWKYYCKKQYEFDKPPKYCSDYKNREDGDA